MREVGSVGEWKFQHHRMARFEDGKLFASVAALDDEGSRWTWMVMLPERDPGRRSRGESDTALEAVRDADAVAKGSVPDEADPEAVRTWVAEHLQWRSEVDRSETEATQKWGD